MKAVIVCVSVSHGNTRRIADAMAQALAAPVVEPEELEPADLAGYDLVGFGSGVFTGRLHPRLRHFVRSLPPARPARRAFVFATSGLPEPGFRPFTRPLAHRLERKGFEVVGGFTARGHDTWLPFRLVGGINEHRPDARDLAAAHTFATGLHRRTGGAS
ncbi:MULTISPECIES: flavodoxin family protein [Kitasatospora]|uniref:Flavodoxin family protein n=1 Tax=Kitasatospora cathayae TaxID=3004092 RepID=A0ABY7QD96_9ACTN|nr:flavodoxin family protein [Kitasatospora sp. HUAS 3-15]WBP90735.1 flavodoxin family protein [Kitasatospora sp. HUAS 3-15]